MRINKFHPVSILNIFMLIAMLVSLLGSGVTPVYAATLTVVNTNDSGPGSLREAISGAIPGDTVTFDTALSGTTIHLASTLTIDQNITIDGSALASKITISGDTLGEGTGDVRVFYLNPNVDASMNSLIITKGYSLAYGAGIYVNNASTLTIANSILSDNFANGNLGGAIYVKNSGGLYITNSVLSDNYAAYGGGIYNSGTLTVANSTFSNNTAGTYGGGIDNYYSTGALTVTNSTFSGNGNAHGGAIYINGEITQKADITNSTFFGNRAAFGAGIDTDGGTLTVTNSTFSNNFTSQLHGGGGIRIATNGVLNYSNTIIANSFKFGTLVPDTDCVIQIPALLVDHNSNLVEDGSCSASLSGDPNLDVLADNGGPTLTVGLLAGSPAIDAGSDAICTDVGNLDQRGVTRPIGAHCDIGAFEKTAAIPINLIVNNTNDSGVGSLRQTLLDAASGDTITFDEALSGGIIRLASTLTVDKDVTIDSSALASKITISGDTTGDGAGDVQVFYINSNMVTLDSVMITKGISTYGGGGVYIWDGSNVIIKNSTISDSTAPNFGGGISSFAASLTIENSTISNNSSSYYSNSFGGGIYNGGALLTINNSTITNNFAPETGGISNNGTLTITNSTISGNYATGNGGGGISNLGTLTIANSTISENSGGPAAGGIANGGILTITNSTISGNSAIQGGGVYNAATLNYANTIIANSASGGDCVNSGTIGTNANNLVEDGTCAAALSGDPKLDVLADNGGPTLTFALLAGSPAIDAGDDLTCSSAPVINLDQRGATRPFGAHCDIGAFEKTAAIPIILIVNNPNDSGGGSLRQTLLDAATGDTITFDPSLSGATIRLASPLTINKDITIDGSALASPITISGDTNGDGTIRVQVFLINGAAPAQVFQGNRKGAVPAPPINGVTVTLDGVTIKGGFADLAAGGGGIDIADGSTVIITNSTIAQNTSYTGGGISNSGTLTIDNSIIADNSASFNSDSTSGGIYNGGTLTITNSILSNNAATNNGGIGNDGTLTIANSTIAGNSAPDYAGGIANNGTLTVINTTFSDNSSGFGGGGIYNNVSGTLNYANTIIANTTSGGDCLNDGGTIGTNINNLVEDGSCSASMSGDPSLDVLANNGGSTLTYGLLAGSPAIDAGDDLTCAAAPVNNLDQRGVARPIGAHCDIGSYEKTPTFADVPLSYWSNTSIERLYNAGITSGCTVVPFNYCPMNPVTRAQMAIFLLRGMYGNAYAPPPATGTKFTDVPLGTFGAAWIEQLATEGITNGCGGGNYCPNTIVSRAQMAIFLVRAKHGIAFVPPLATGIFPDVPVGSFGANYIEQLAADAITSGCGGGNYCPNTIVKRDSMAVFLVKTFNLP